MLTLITGGFRGYRLLGTPNPLWRSGSCRGGGPRTALCPYICMYGYIYIYIYIYIYSCYTYIYRESYICYMNTYIHICIHMCIGIVLLWDIGSVVHFPRELP